MNLFNAWKKLKKLNHVQLLVIGYSIVTLIFTLLLMLPISSKTGKSQSFIDALFMASSGISTCGLTVIDIGSYYSIFGQIILLCDIQVGGIGYMSFFIFTAALLQRKLSIKNHLVACESVSGAHFGYNFNFFNKVITFTIIFELLGALILFFYWLPTYSLLYALYLGIFHSINAFCTAGMSLFPTSFMSFKNSFIVNLTIDVLSLIGGIGFFVINEFYMIGKKMIRKEKYRKLSAHSKLAVITTIIILIVAILTILISEKWTPGQTYKEKILTSTFQSISASTTDGFNSLDIGTMSATSLFMIILLMFIGASPGSTGGGIKTTTIGVIFITILANLRGKKDVNYNERKIPENIISKSFTIFFLFILVTIIDLLLLTNTEKGSFLQIFFEIISAIGNTGLSTGITFNLTDIAKIFLSFTMFIGRVGPLTIGLALLEDTIQPKFKYPEGNILVG